MREKGFSLIESLVSLTIFLMITLASLEFFGMTRTIFFRLKKAEETQEGALFAMDKIKIDVLQAGQGLGEPMNLGIVEGIEVKNNALLLRRRELRFSLLKDLPAGETQIFFEDTTDLKPGKEICVFDRNKGETKIISSVNKDSIVLSSPLDFSYLKEESSIFLLEKISLFFEVRKNILRRKVNAAPPQPLLEDVNAFSFSYEKPESLVRISFSLQSQKERIHEISLFPKNLAFVLSR